MNFQRVNKHITPWTRFVSANSKAASATAERDGKRNFTVLAEWWKEVPDKVK